MAPKRVPGKRPAATGVGSSGPSRRVRIGGERARELVGVDANQPLKQTQSLLPRHGRRRADPQALGQRAEAVAKAAAARYATPDGTLIDCMCIGQPHDDEEPAPLLEECTQRPELWKLPPKVGRIRLAFLWHIIKGHRVDGADSCVVRLDDAERQGVPLPPDLAPMVAEMIDSGAKDEGALPASQASLVGRV